MTCGLKARAPSLTTTTEQVVNRALDFVSLNHTNTTPVQYLLLLELTDWHQSAKPKFVLQEEGSSSLHIPTHKSIHHYTAPGSYVTTTALMPGSRVTGSRRILLFHLLCCVLRFIGTMITGTWRGFDVLECLECANSSACCLCCSPQSYLAFLPQFKFHT